MLKKIKKNIIIIFFIILAISRFIEINNNLINKTYDFGYRQIKFDNLIEFINSGYTIKQYFKPQEEKKYLTNLSIKIGTYQNTKLSCIVNIRLFKVNNEGNNYLTSSKQNCNDLIDNEYNNFTFTKKINLEKNKQYLIEIKIDGNSKDNLAFYYLKNTNNKKLIYLENEKNQKKTLINGELSMTIYKINKINTNHYFLISVITFIFLVVFLKFTLNKNNVFYRFAITFIFICGFLWLIIIPPFDGPDEHEHFNRIAEISANHISSAKYGGYFSDYFTGYKKLIDSSLWSPDYLNRNIYNETANLFSINLEEKNGVGFTTASGYHPISHLHLVSIMKILEFFNIKPIIIFYLLRLTNLLLFLFIVLITLIYNKHYLRYLLVIFSFPGILSQAAVISTDSIITSSIIFSFFYILNPENKRNFLNRFLFIFSLIYISSTKFFYIAFGILFLFFFLNYKNKTKNILIFLLISLLLILNNVLWLKYIKFEPKGKDIRFPTTNPSQQVEKIKSNLIYFFSLYTNTSIDNFVNRLEKTNYRNFTNKRQITASLFLSGFATVLFVILSLHYSNHIKNNLKNKFFLNLFLLISFIITFSLTLFFNISYQNLNVSWRYFGFYNLVPLSIGYVLNLKNKWRFECILNLEFILIFINILNLMLTVNLFLPLWFN